MEGNALPVTGEMIKAAASELWNKMPDFQGVGELRWLNGWLDGFKKRH